MAEEVGVAAERQRLIVSFKDRSACKTRGKILEADLVTHEIHEMSRRVEPG